MKKSLSVYRCNQQYIRDYYFGIQVSSMEAMWAFGNRYHPQVCIILKTFQFSRCRHAFVRETDFHAPGRQCASTLAAGTSGFCRKALAPPTKILKTFPHFPQNLSQYFINLTKHKMNNTIISLNHFLKVFIKIMKSLLKQIFIELPS